MRPVFRQGSETCGRPGRSRSGNPLAECEEYLHEPRHRHGGPGAPRDDTVRGGRPDGALEEIPMLRSWTMVAVAIVTGVVLGDRARADTTTTVTVTTTTTTTTTTLLPHP